MSTAAHRGESMLNRGRLVCCRAGAAVSGLVGAGAGSLLGCAAGGVLDRRGGALAIFRSSGGRPAEQSRPA